MAVIYAFVARGTDVVAEFTDFKGNFKKIAHSCLLNLPSNSNKFTTCKCDGHTFHYLREDGYAYCVVARGLTQFPLTFLERVKTDFISEYGHEKASTTPHYSLSKEFGLKLKEHMKYCSDHPDEMSKLAKEEAQIFEVKGVMIKKVVKVEWVFFIVLFNDFL